MITGLGAGGQGDEVESVGKEWKRGAEDIIIRTDTL